MHCYGRARIHDDAEARANIERLIAAVESHRERPWSISELPADDVARMIRNISSFEIPPARIEGKFKLNQGEKRERTRAAVAMLEVEGEAEIAEYIRRYNEWGG